MRVQHNIAAMNSYRIYNNNANALGKNLEKLSSGYRINRAGDDAAGLAISEKMRGQITGLNAASKNVKDGIALVQTAEGAMQEVHDMLGRMKYLATQSANGTYQDEVDRENIQKEVDSLIDEIDRIADTANFNGQALLDGSLSGGSKKVTVNNVKSGLSAASKGSYSLNMGNGNAMTADANLTDGAQIEFGIGLDDGTEYNVNLTIQKDGTNGVKLVNEKGETLKTATQASKFTNGDVTEAIISELNKQGLSSKFDISMGTKGSAAINLKSKVEGSAGYSVVGAGANLSTGTKAAVTIDGTDGKNAGRTIADADITGYTGSNADEAIFTINGKRFVLASAALGTATTGLGSDVTVLHGATLDDAANRAKIQEVTGLNIASGAGTATGGGATAGITVLGGGDSGNGLQLQIGDTGEKSNKMAVKVGDMHAKALGLGGLNVSSADSANASIDRIKRAIDTVSSNRGDLGAVQNRLEHTSNNLSVMTENLQNAESNIRDTDVADEMMKYTKNNILLQSAQAMLAQANQLPQGVLQLLQ